MTRIIAGIARGRQIKVPATGTRPTSDRAREGLFSSLQARFGFVGERVLDLFAGSGALGLEAASRGADSVTLVDSAPAATAIITANAEAVRQSFEGVDANGNRNPLPDIRVVEAKASTFIGNLARNTEQAATVGDARHTFTMVLADPPYDLPDEDVREMLEALIPLLAPDAVVVVERSRDSVETAWPEGFEPTGQKVKKRTFGIARFDMAIWRG